MSPNHVHPERLSGIEELIRLRRTNLLIDTSRSVPDDIVERLCALVQWAPNHKRTWPWHLAVVSGDGRARLGAALSDDQADDGETDTARLDKTRRKYGRAPVCIVVGYSTDPSPERSGENRDAAAAGIQNLLLGATAFGLASFWSSPPSRRAPRTRELCGFPGGVELLGVIYVGWPNGSVEVPLRPPLTIHTVR